MDLEQYAPTLGLERPVMDARRAHRVGIPLEFFAALAGFIVADDQVAGNKKHLFPILVHERRGRINARREAQQPRAAEALHDLLPERTRRRDARKEQVLQIEEPEHATGPVRHAHAALRRCGDAWAAGDRKAALEAVTDADALRPSGSSWNAPGTVTAGAVPATGRVLLGAVQVLTDTKILVGSADVVVQQVTP